MKTDQPGPNAAYALAFDPRLLYAWRFATDIAPSMETPSAAAALRTLFVEDNEYLRDIIGELLQEEGLAVTTCADAEEAEAEFHRNPYDLVITDVSLPRMSGTDLAKRLLGAAPSTWVVFSSGYALDKGLNQFGPNVRSLPKPFEVEALQALLLEIRRSQAG